MVERTLYSLISILLFGFFSLAQQQDPAGSVPATTKAGKGKNAVHATPKHLKKSHRESGGSLPLGNGKSGNTRLKNAIDTAVTQQVRVDSLRKTNDTLKTSTTGTPPADSANHKALAATDLVKNPLDTLRKLPNNAFGIGEHLHFNVKYGFVNAGDANMMTHDTLLPNGRRALRVQFTVDSKPVFNWVYKVVDRYSTIIDAIGLFPWRFEQHISEGGYRRDFVADFDQLNHVARTTEKDYKIPPYVHDIMSAFYFARTIDYAGYRPGQLVHFQNFYKDSTYDLDVKYKGRQQIEVPAGKFNCIIVEPIAREGGLFKANGRVLVWLTDDDRKIPVRVSAQIPIGSIDSELLDFDGVNGPISAKVED